MDPATDWFSTAHILIVDDDVGVQRVLVRMLGKHGFRNVTCVADAEIALDLWVTRPPDLALIDLHMPRTNGFEFLQRIREHESGAEFLPVIMLTGDADPDVRRRALDLGAHDFLTKPFDTTEVLLRIRNLLRTRLLNIRLLDSNNALERRVRERTRTLDEARLEALEHLARAAEFRDDVTGQHTHRVGSISAGIARELGWDDEAIELIRSAAPLHDIGKIGIPDSILMKAGPLTVEEFDVMKKHTTIGAAILVGSRSPVFVLAREIALTHHERWDGTGYPAGTRGEAIAIAGRIVCAADVYDALTNERPYKRAMSVEATMAEIEAHSGTQFDTAVVEALKRLRAAGLISPETPARP